MPNTLKGIATKTYIRSVLLRYYEYPKGSFVLICFQHLSLIDVAFLPCLYNDYLFYYGYNRTYI